MATGPSGSSRLRSPLRLFLPVLIILISFPSAVHALPDGLTGYGFPRTLHRLIDQHPGESGAYILEKGEEAFLARAWMVENAVERIDLLTFIWSVDNIGVIATEALLRAAERGVKVRVVVDDMILEEEDLDLLLALADHPNIDIRIYNPVETVGVSLAETAAILATDFPRFNQRLHNKTFLADGLIGITGGRNVANEYFDYDQKYNFRDRDILVVGPVVGQMEENFELYWQSELSRPIEELLAARNKDIGRKEIERAGADLHACAARMVDRLPLVRFALENQEERLAEILRRLVWSTEVWFVSDRPGKNLGSPGLNEGGEMADALRQAIVSARQEITIQSPYLIMEEDGMGLYGKLLEGVEIRISTNSLASTDNIAAFSGYMADREKLLAAGFLIREFRPDPQIERELVSRYLGPKEKAPVFVLHAKTLVIDEELLYVGTFNLDPRSVHRNTEEGIFLRSRELANQVKRQIEEEMRPENSWNPAVGNPNPRAGFWRRVKLVFFRLFAPRSLL